MQRVRLDFLEQWIQSTNRKPLVIRGARQVGKTWLVRYFAQLKNRQLIEINFEKRPELISLFSSNDPHQILLNLSAIFQPCNDPSKMILFLDEIQAAPELLAKLRWFAEDMPELAVIAAGSLLEFVLDDHSFSMPVGRINYMHLEPLSFEEFLLAAGHKNLKEYIESCVINSQIPSSIHEKLLGIFKEYLFVGGMPAVVSSWINKRSLHEVGQIQYDLMSTYRDDLAKYRGRMPIERLEEVLRAVPLYLGEKFVYTRVNPLTQIASTKGALELLCKARVCHRVNGCAGNGIPLGAEILERYLKIIFIDVGLCCSSLGLSFDQISSVDELILVNKGGLAEQVVGQILRTIVPAYMEPELYYWHRDEKGASSELDYLIQYQNKILPLEVKAGSTGSLKSLHYFMNKKGLKTALRVNSEPPSQFEVKTVDFSGHPVQYTLLSLPFYLLGQIHRLLLG
jgi:predicted AAA+ superfamily ATPase